MMRFTRIITILLVAMCSFLVSEGKVNVLMYDSSIVINEAAIDSAATAAVDSMLKAHPQLNGTTYTAFESRHIFADDTFDFYLLLILLVSFGVIRYVNPRYFQNLIRAFRSPSFSSQQLKDQMGSAVFHNLLMNIFFAVSAGTYTYYLLRLELPQRYAVYPPSLLIAILILSFVALYGAKYAVMRFSGWAFNVRVVINHYMYNVFLINKIIAVILLPFTILIAFAGPMLAVPAMIVSLVLVGLLFINRYIRSWQVLGGFFQYSRFHFFAYLCASELLPMALLAKLLIRGMYY